MTSRVRELAVRRAGLVEQSSRQRAFAARDAEDIGNALHTVDRAVSVLQRLRRSPVLVTVAVIGVVVFRRHPVVSWLARGVAVAGAARRVASALRSMADETPGPEREGPTPGT
jgi:hypothetical protein